MLVLAAAISPSLPVTPVLGESLNIPQGIVLVQFELARGL